MKIPEICRDLDHCAAKANKFHQMALTAHGNAVKYAISSGRYLRAAKIQVGHGKWREWVLKHFPAGERTARVYMQLSKKADILEPDANRSIRQALRALMHESGEPKRFDPDVILKNASFRVMVRRAIRDWTDYEKEALEINPNVGDEFLRKMEEVRQSVHFESKTVEESYREWIEFTIKVENLLYQDLTPRNPYVA